MKIIHENDSQMTLRLRPWLLWIVGAILTSIGLSGAVLWPQVHTFTCRRDTTAPAICQSYTTGLSSSDHQVLPLKDIQGTKIHTIKGKSERNYRLLLLTNEGEISPISIDISDQGTVQNWVEEIEVFRKDTQKQNLLIEYDNRLSGYLFAGIFTSMGLILGLLLEKVVVCKIDKTLGQLTLANYGLLGNSQAEYLISDIRGVTVQTTGGFRDGSRTYRIALFMYSGEYIPFPSYYASRFRHHQQTVVRISEFLDLEPMIENDQKMSLKKIFSTVKEIGKRVFTTRQRREAELPSLQQAVMNNRNDAEAHFQYGLSLYILQRYQEAQPCLEEAQRLFVLSGQVQRLEEIEAFLYLLNQKL
ncbi:tetratricopeptide repeat protein [Anabaena sp. CCY 0017]|uniref:tetratricopeptide repeat protein n=1 Tax=Anabaena sp. CCY 0017 TaxID=3103866 RepID=UPI0039C6DD1C